MPLLWSVKLEKSSLVYFSMTALGMDKLDTGKEDLTLTMAMKNDVLPQKSS